MDNLEQKPQSFQTAVSGSCISYQGLIYKIYKNEREISIYLRNG